MQHVAYALQFENDLVDFLRRSASNAPDQLIQGFGSWVIGRVSLASLPVQRRHVAPGELSDLTLNRVRRRLIDIAQFFRCTPVRRSVLLRA